MVPLELSAGRPASQPASSLPAAPFSPYEKLLKYSSVFVALQLAINVTFFQLTLTVSPREYFLCIVCKIIIVETDEIQCILSHLQNKSSKMKLRNTIV